MNFRDFSAGKDDNDRRLDRVIRIFLKDKSLGEIYKLLRKGLIKVNQKKAKPDSHIFEGDIISIAEFLLANVSEEKTEIESIKSASIDSQNLQENKPEIVFENSNLLIINKPYGRRVHESSSKYQKNNQISLDKEVLNYYLYHKKDNINDSLSFHPGPLHRLDRNTSGLLVFSMSLMGAKWFSESIKNHTVQKKYLGIAEGNLKECEDWEDLLADSDTPDDGFYTVAQSDSGKKALTRARPIAHGHYKEKEITLIEYSIKTGRKHQIRAQSQIHGHPLLGDKAYGAKEEKNLKREYFLHAFSLTFPKDNPLGLPEEIKIPLPLDFEDLLSSCQML